MQRLREPRGRDPLLLLRPAHQEPLAVGLHVHAQLVAFEGDPDGHSLTELVLVLLRDPYFADIHLVAGPGSFAPAENGGGVFKVTFGHGTPSLPQPVATGRNFPTSVTVCTGRDCPTPP